MEIVPDAAKNVLNFMRRGALENDQDRDGLVPSLTPVHTLRGHTQTVSSVAFLPDSEYLLSGGWDGTVRKWRVTDGCQVGEVMDHRDSVKVVAVSADGKVIASGGEDGKVIFWNCETCEKLVQPQEKHSRWINSLSFAPDSLTIASGSGDGSIIVYSVRTGERVAGLDRGAVTFVAFSPAGGKIAGAGGLNVRVWDSSLEKELIPPILVEAHIWSLVWSLDGRQLICGNVNGDIQFFDSSNGVPLATCPGHTDAVSSIAVSQGGAFFASASLDRTVRLRSISTHHQLAYLEYPRRSLAVSISPDGRYLASGGYNGKLHIWRLPWGFDRTLQENTDDPEKKDEESRDSGAVQGQQLTRIASGDSWLDMPAVLGAPAPTVPVDGGAFSQFFGENYISAQPKSRDDRSAKWKKKAKESRQNLFKQVKHFRDVLSPRDGFSDTNNSPRPSSQKISISRIRRWPSLMPEDAEHPAEERDSDQQRKNKAKSPKLKSLVAYSRTTMTLVVASNDPPVQQEKWYFTKRGRKLIRTPGPPGQAASQQQGPRPTPSPSTNPSTTSPQERGSSSSTTPCPSAAGSSTDIDVEGCGCCGFFISVRRL